MDPFLDIKIKLAVGANSFRYNDGKKTVSNNHFEVNKKSSYMEFNYSYLKKLERHGIELLLVLKTVAHEIGSCLVDKYY